MPSRLMPFLMLGLAGALSLSTAACGSKEGRGAGFGATDESDDDDDSSTGDDDDSSTGDDDDDAKPKPDSGKPGCAGDSYSETAITPKTSLSGLKFSKDTANDYLLAALEKRYPLGKEIVEGGLDSSLAQSQGNCIDRFLSDKSSAATVLRQASTVVHECGHFYDIGESKGSAAAYVIRDDLKFSCKSGDTTDRGGKTFARSLIRKDDYYAKRKACPSGTASAGCDSYAEVYLNGSPTDSTFDSGDQGYSFVLEEAAQYVNSLATALAFQDQITNMKVSERDGILTFLWYIERYLAMAKESYPDAYELLSTDECWRQATLTVWDRGWYYLGETKGMSNLGFDDAAIEKLVNDSKLTAEIDALRDLECK